MRKNIGYVISWTLYWVGHCTSIPMHWTYGYWLYPVYNCLMCWSVDVQDWSKADGPWSSKKTW
jgi:hypothetical protein